MLLLINLLMMLVRCQYQCYKGGTPYLCCEHGGEGPLCNDDNVCHAANSNPTPCTSSGSQLNL